MPNNIDNINNIIVAIDGPAGAGKSTVARLIAEELNLLYIDTGAMYRALTLKALQQGVDLADGQSLTELAETTEICLASEPGQILKVFCDAQDVTDQIRTSEVSRYVAQVSQFPGVRDHMLRLQRLVGQSGGMVMDGRDIGSRVFPEANFKFYITASDPVRVWRRQQEMRAKGFDPDPAELEKEMIERDLTDRNREVGPLIQVPDAVVIDTTELSIEEVVGKMLEIINGGR